MNDVIRIGFIQWSLSEGGIGRVSSIIMNQLATQPHFNVYTMIYEEPSKPEIYLLNENVTKEYLLSKHFNMRNAIFREKIIGKLVKWIKRNNIDIVIACGDLFFIASVIAAKLANVKVICWDHTSMFSNYDQKFQNFSRSFGVMFSDIYLVLTKESYKYYTNKYKFKKFRQIYNPVATESFKSSEYNKESKRIISVGRFSYAKNFSRLLDIAKIVFDKHPDWYWDIYGDGNQKEELLNKREKLGLENNVVFMGQVNDIYEHYPQYSFMVMTSRYEGFPMTLLEGAANRLPLVSFDIHTGPNEIITSQNGFLCDSNDDIDMANRICELIDNIELRINMSGNSYNTSETYRIDSIIKQWESLLYSLVC